MITAPEEKIAQNRLRVFQLVVILGSVPVSLPTIYHLPTKNRLSSSYARGLKLEIQRIENTLGVTAGKKTLTVGSVSMSIEKPIRTAQTWNDLSYKWSEHVSSVSGELPSQVR